MRGDIDRIRRAVGAMSAGSDPTARYWAFADQWRADVDALRFAYDPPAVELLAPPYRLDPVRRDDFLAGLGIVTRPRSDDPDDYADPARRRWPGWWLRRGGGADRLHAIIVANEMKLTNDPVHGARFAVLWPDPVTLAPDDGRWRDRIPPSPYDPGWDAAWAEHGPAWLTAVRVVRMAAGFRAGVPAELLKPGTVPQPQPPAPRQRG